MSARSRIVGPGFAPRSVATTALVAPPVSIVDAEVAECLEHRALGLREYHAQLGVLVEAPAQPNRSREFGARFIVQSVEQRRHGRLA